MTTALKQFYEEWHAAAGTNRTREVRDRDLMAIEALHGCDAVFELGVGAGVILSMIPSDRKCGVDISERAVQLARDAVAPTARECDIRVVDIDSEDLPWGDAEFGGCVASEVLEHLFDPVHALAELNRVLKEDGRVVISVPNIGYFVCRYHLLVKGEVSDFHGNGLVVNEHLRYYSVGSLTRLLELAGFGDIRIRGVMKQVVSGAQQSSASAPRRGLKYWAMAMRPTPVNVLAKLNRVFRLFDRHPGLFAVGLVAEARKIGDSKFTHNAAVDHQLRTEAQAALNLNSI